MVKNIFGKDKKGHLWIEIPDKIITTNILNEKEKRFCAPHRIPHKLPFFGKKIVNEECHIHKSLWRDSHHIPFCKMLGCKHYQVMLEARKKYKKTK